MDKQQYHGEVVNIYNDTYEVLAVDVYRNPWQPGRDYVITVHRWIDSDPMVKESTVGVLCPDNARSLAQHLLNAAEEAAVKEANLHAGIAGLRKLPTIRLCGATFFIDEQLKQLRSVDNPDHFFELDASRMWQ